MHFTRAERDLITSWSTPPSWDERQGPPGMGNFLIKIGRRPGVPVHVDLTRAELTAGVNDTNRRWTTTAPHGAHALGTGDLQRPAASNGAGVTR